MNVKLLIIFLLITQHEIGFGSKEIDYHAVNSELEHSMQLMNMMEDTIFTTNDEQIIANINVIGDNKIAYTDSSSGKTRKISKKRVTKIVYDNGYTVDVNHDKVNRRLFKRNTNIGNVIVVTIAIAGATVLTLLVVALINFLKWLQ